MLNTFIKVFCPQKWQKCLVYGDTVVCRSEKGKVTINDMMEKFPYSKSWVGQLLNTLEVYQKCKTRRDWVSLVPHIKMDPEDQVRRGRPPVWAHPSIDTIEPEDQNTKIKLIPKTEN